jgi:hypothetical protein
MTELQALLTPVFLHVALIFIVAGIMGRGRRDAVVARDVRLADIALDNRAWPERLRKLSNNYDNQFQQPMLWYSAVALFVATGLADGVAVALSWLYLLARLAHSYIHIGSNYVPHRFYAFLASIAILVALWLWLAFRVYGIA